MILHDWRHQFYFSLHVNYQSYGYTRPIAESITWRYAEHSNVTNVTPAGYNDVNAIVTAPLLPNIHTIQSNALHITLKPLVLYICSVNIWSADAIAMLFRNAIPLTEPYILLITVLFWKIAYQSTSRSVIFTACIKHKH